jgi:hypothetical protein
MVLTHIRQVGIYAVRRGIDRPLSGYVKAGHSLHVKGIAPRTNRRGTRPARRDAMREERVCRE